jgi:hypothetical protein
MAITSSEHGDRWLARSVSVLCMPEGISRHRRATCLLWHLPGFSTNGEDIGLELNNTGFSNTVCANIDAS